MISPFHTILYQFTDRDGTVLPIQEKRPPMNTRRKEVVLLQHHSNQGTVLGVCVNGENEYYHENLRP